MPLRRIFVFFPRLFAITVVVGLPAGFLATGCSDKDRRLSPNEAYDRKLALIEGSKDDITYQQAAEFMYFPAWTQRELEARMESIRSRNAREREYGRREFLDQWEKRLETLRRTRAGETQD